MLTHIAGLTGRNNIRSGETAAARNGYFVFALKFNASFSTIIASMMILLKNVMPLLLRQIMGQA